MLAFQWIGFYAGLNAGGRWTELGAALHRLDTGSTERLAFAPGGFSGGAQAGYLFQAGHLAAGIEISYIGGVLAEDTRPSAVQADRSRTLSLGNMATAALRAGWAQDRWLAYVKGGLAAALVNVRTGIASTGAPTSESSQYEYGWTAGVGVEYALTDTLVAGLEYAYLSVGGEDRGQAQLTGYAPLAHETVEADAHIITARLNYKLAR